MPLPWAEFLSYWFNWILVGALVLGVVATYFIVISGNVKESALKRELAAANITAENAKATAAAANERTAALENETARLTASNLELTTNLERERAARAQIEAGLASRHVSAEQRTALISALKGVKMSVLLSQYNDPEASSYAEEVRSALIDAGQEVAEGSKVISGAANLQGLFVEEAADPRLVNAMIAARLITQKMQSTQNPMLHTGEGLNAVFIGIKPTAF